MDFEIEGRGIGPQHPPYIIAELSANHNGSLERALKSIETAKRCGADAVKIQTYTAETMTIDCDRPEFTVQGGLWDGMTLYQLYQAAHTPFEWHAAMFDFARRIGITIFSTPFDESAVDLLESIGAPAYKIASFEATDLPLVRYVARTGKPMIISTGMASEAEIAETVDTARTAGCSHLVLLHCISSYPAPVAQANVRQIAALARRFGCLSGLSDHTMGTAVPVAAVAVGASVIEKHFTLSRAEKGPDSEFSLEPTELREMCENARIAWAALGQEGFRRQPAEDASRIFRRSIYFVRDVAQGAEITQDDIRRIRPGLGLAPKHFEELLGRRTKVAVARGTPASWGLLE